MPAHSTIGLFSLAQTKYFALQLIFRSLSVFYMSFFRQGFPLQFHGFHICGQSSFFVRTLDTRKETTLFSSEAAENCPNRKCPFFFYDKHDVDSDFFHKWQITTFRRDMVERTVSLSQSLRTLNGDKLPTMSMQTVFLFPETSRLCFGFHGQCSSLVYCLWFHSICMALHKLSRHIQDHWLQKKVVCTQWELSGCRVVFHLKQTRKNVFIFRLSEKISAMIPCG